MIPKIIHYCWFGRGEKSKTIKKCLRSWEKKCKDFKTIECNEDNFNIESHPFVKAAYEDKNWAFVSDYVRLYALNLYGGIYMDTDVQLVKPIDGFLENEAFLGFENKNNVANGLIFGIEKGHWFTQKLLADYDSILYVANDVNFRMKNTNTEIATKILVDMGLKLNNQFQIINGIAVYPSEYFCPLDVNTFLMHKTKNTVSIHWYEGAWTSARYKEWKRRQIRRNRIDKVRCLPQRMLRKFLGDSTVDRLKSKIK